MSVKETFYSVSALPGGIRVALLTDFHNRPNPFILASLRRHRPSLICIAGDIFYSTYPLVNQVHVLPFLEECVGVAPTFLSLGNHEQAVTAGEIREIEKTGTVVLDNTYTTINLGGSEITIGGLTSGYVTAYRRWHTAHPGRAKPEHGEITDHDPEMVWLSEFAAVPGYKLLLSHHPEYFPEVPPAVDLVLSGHTHGGQIAYYSLSKRRMCGLFAPGQGWFPQYSKGVYDDRLIISAGLSNTAGIPRLFNPTEVVFISSASR